MATGLYNDCGGLAAESERPTTRSAWGGQQRSCVRFSMMLAPQSIFYQKPIYENLHENYQTYSLPTLSLYVVGCSFIGLK